MPPRKYKVKLAERVVLNEKFTHYQFELVEPNVMEFLAGQYVSFLVDPVGHHRSYSIINTPSDTHGFEILLDVEPAGMGTNYLEGLELGQEIEVLAPLGFFTVNSTDPTIPLVFIATGSGIAPLRSMLYDQLEKYGKDRPMTLYWGLRYETQLCWEEDLKELMVNFPNVIFHPVISRAINAWPLCHGRVTDCLSVHNVDPTAEYYVCGSTKMVVDVIRVLGERGITKDHILLEKFY
jgi:NAD(P)H-flavin reductase